MLGVSEMIIIAGIGLAVLVVIGIVIVRRMDR